MIKDFKENFMTYIVVAILAGWAALIILKPGAPPEVRFGGQNAGNKCYIMAQKMAESKFADLKKAVGDRIEDGMIDVQDCHLLSNKLIRFKKDEDRILKINKLKETLSRIDPDEIE